MTKPTPDHPPEETLIAYALGENGKDAEAHIQECAQCRTFVDEMRQIQATVAGLDEEEPPVDIAKRVIRTARSTGLAGLARGVLGAPAGVMFLINLATIIFLMFVFLMVTLLM